MLARPAHPGLTYTKFAPARPDKAIKWVGAQIWEGAPREESLLVADCLTEEWAKSLSVSFNDATIMTAKVAAANQVIRDLLAAISTSAQACTLTDPATAEALTATAVALKARAKQAGLNPA